MACRGSGATGCDVGCSRRAGASAMRAAASLRKASSSSFTCTPSKCSFTCTPSKCPGSRLTPTGTELRPTTGVLRGAEIVSGAVLGGAGGLIICCGSGWAACARTRRDSERIRSSRLCRASGGSRSSTASWSPCARAASRCAPMSPAVVLSTHASERRRSSWSRSRAYSADRSHVGTSFTKDVIARASTRASPLNVSAPACASTGGTCSTECERSALVIPVSVLALLPPFELWLVPVPMSPAISPMTWLKKETPPPPGARSEHKSGGCAASSMSSCVVCAAASATGARCMSAMRAEPVAEAC